jgi:hypothetical protein
MSQIYVGRLLLGAPGQFYEGSGDPVTNNGAAIVPDTRKPLTSSVTLDTLTADGVSDTTANRLRIRRQLRSLLNNTPLKQQGYLFLQYGDDPEQDGWYQCDPAQFTDGDGASGLATGWWQLQSVNWYLAGRPRTHREARNVKMKDLRTGLYPRDTLGNLYSVDFSALSALALTVLPPGALLPYNTVTSSRVPTVALPASRDGGVSQQAVGQADLSCIAYDRPEIDLNTADVVVYDRRGAGDAPTTGPGATWEEVYGVDYPWNWLTAGQPQDAPVVDNGLVRVRYDPGSAHGGTGVPGFRVDAWNGTAYVEQGKMCPYRNSNVGQNFLDTWASAGIYADGGYTPDRAAIEVDMGLSTDLSHERIFVTVQRGESTVQFEYYAAPAINGSAVGAYMYWFPALTAGAQDSNESAFLSNSQTQPSPVGTGVGRFTAGNSDTWTGGTFPTTFGSAENFLVLLRCPGAVSTIGPFQTTFALLQSASAVNTVALSSAYGVSQNALYLVGPTSVSNPYTQVQVSFTSTVADQVAEAETIRNASGTTSQVTDATASNGLSVEDTQTAQTNNPLLKNASALLVAQYRIWARVKVASGNTGSYRASIGGAYSSVVTSTSTTWTWIDLGEVAAPVASPALGLVAWRSAGSASGVFVDRLELFLVQDRVRTGAAYAGSRDLAQAALYDSRVSGAVVSR